MVKIFALMRRSRNFLLSLLFSFCPLAESLDIWDLAMLFFDTLLLRMVLFIEFDSSMPVLLNWPTLSTLLRRSWLERSALIWSGGCRGSPFFLSKCLIKDPLWLNSFWQNWHSLSMFKKSVPLLDFRIGV